MKLMPITSRTNSLGRASTDCHSCLSANRVCDRQRPWCRTCAEGACSGYSLTLTWNEGIASRGKFRGKTTPVDDVSAGVQRKAPSEESTIQFESYDPNQVQRKRKRGSRTSSPTFTQPLAEEQTQTSPCLTSHGITVNSGVTYDPLYWLMSDETAAQFQPFDLNVTNELSWNPFDISLLPPLPSIPSPGQSAEKKRLLCYCNASPILSDF